MYNSDEPPVLEPPKYDTLHIKFFGDEHCLILPYCEVANGSLAELQKNRVQVVMRDNDHIFLSFEEFVSLVEQTFDTKQIIELSVQFAESYELHKIL